MISHWGVIMFLIEVWLCFSCWWVRVTYHLFQLNPLRFINMKAFENLLSHTTEFEWSLVHLGRITSSGSLPLFLVWKFCLIFFRVNLHYSLKILKFYFFSLKRRYISLSSYQKISGNILFMVQQFKDLCFSNAIITACLYFDFSVWQNF